MRACVHMETKVVLQEETHRSELELNKVVSSGQKHPSPRLSQSSPWHSTNFLLYLKRDNYGKRHSNSKVGWQAFQMKSYFGLSEVK